jgi:hypothetical protein
MPDLIAISQGLNAVKAATEIVKTIAGLRDSAKLLENTVELNQKILSVQTALSDAQAEQATLIQTIREHEEEIARFKAWETERQRYELKKVSQIGSTAYVLKQDAQGADPPHCICTACYQHAKKGILQPTAKLEMRLRVWQCLECKSTIIVDARSLTHVTTETS